MIISTIFHNPQTHPELVIPTINLHLYKRNKPFLTSKTLFTTTKFSRKKLMASSAEDYDRSAEVMKFEESKIGVKGLVDSGITTIPRFFIHPQQTLANIKAGPTHDVTVPIIDLSGVDSDERPKIVKKVSHAAREFGFFQVVNHGVPLQLMKAIIGGIKGFHEQSAEVKKRLYRRDTEKGVALFSNMDLLHSKAASWRDTLQVRLGPNPPDPEDIPEICRKEIIEWDKEATRVVDILMELLSEGLGLEKERLKKLTCSEGRTMAGHYYPPCPQPDLTFGVSSHKDAAALTLLLQGYVGGFQIKYGDGWLDVNSVPGALVINIGDLLQIMSNEEYRSVDHRVLAHPWQDGKISVAIFLVPSEKDKLFGPFPELITKEKPAIYRQFTLGDFMKRFLESNLSDKSLPDYFKL